MSVKLVKKDYIDNLVKDLLSQVPKAIHTLDTYNGQTYVFKCASQVPCGSITFPSYTTGLIIEQREGWTDAVIIAIDPARNLYIGYRNGTTWQSRRL